MNLLSQYHPDICLYTDEEHLISGYPQGFEQVPPGYKPDAVELTLNEVARHLTRVRKRPGWNAVIDTFL
jgi:hypothetical protein